MKTPPRKTVCECGRPSAKLTASGTDRACERCRAIESRFYSGRPKKSQGGAR
jgi:hypothetical protein